SEPERHRRDGARGEGGEPEIAGNRHRREHVRDLEMPDREPVADIGPGRLAREHKIEAFFFGEALFLGGDEEGAVEQRHEARSDLVALAHASSPGPSRPAAVIRLCAISAILRFWFIAVLRRSA